MTIGVVETLTVKQVSLWRIGDCDFLNKDPECSIWRNVTKQGYHSTGNQILYNQDGEQLETKSILDQHII